MDAKVIGALMELKSEIIDLEHKGFSICSFPKKLQGMMAQEILKTMSELLQNDNLDNFEQAINLIENIDDDSFVKLFTKPNRNFSHEIYLEVESWISDYLSTIFVNKKMAINKMGDWETKGHPKLSSDSYCVFWRCVREGKESDVGGAHRDSTFGNIVSKQGYDPQLPFESGQWWKIWLPIFGCTSTNSLQMVEGSHNENIDVAIKETRFGHKPFINEQWLNLNENNFLSPLDGQLGQCVCFHDDMVHRAPVNNASRIRVSAEFAVITD